MLAGELRGRTARPEPTPHAEACSRHGYKSLADVEVKLEPLTVLFGPNAAGKSNFLDALRLLSRLGTSRTVRDAFDSPSRGTPLESFSMGPDGRKGLIEQERLVCSLEADLQLQEARP